MTETIPRGLLHPSAALGRRRPLRVLRSLDLVVDSGRWRFGHNPFVRERQRRRSRRIRLMWIFVVGLVLASTGWVLNAVASSNDDLQRAANQSQVIGLLLAVGTAISGLTLWVQRRLSTDQGVSDWAAELARRVAAEEDRNRRNLLGTVHAADIPMSEVAIQQMDELRQWFVAQDSGERMRLDSLESYYRGLGPNGRLVILGAPGSGKTVSAVQLVVHLLRHDPEPQWVPVRFSLAGWDPAQNVDEWMADRLARDYRIPQAHAEDLVRKGRILPVLDGLDEMDSGPASGAPSRAIAILRWLSDEHTVAGQLAGVVVTCRSERYAELAGSGARLEHAREIEVLPLEQGQIRAYIDRVFASDPRTLAAWQPELEALDRPGSAPIWAILATPWRLTLAITLVRAGRSPHDVLSVRTDETPADAATRIQGELLAQYIESATKISGNETEVGDRCVRETTRWLTELARHLQRTSAATGKEFSAIDIVPHRLFDSAPAARRVHAAIAGTIMAMGCLVLAFDGIGPVSDWLTLIHNFFTDDYDPANRLSQDVLPVICLLGLPVLAARLAAAPAPDPVPRGFAVSSFGRRLRRNFEPPLAGAAITLLSTMLLFDMLDYMEWVTVYMPSADIWTVAARIAVLFLLLAVALLVRGRLGRRAGTIALWAVAIGSVWLLFAEVVAELSSQPPTERAVAAIFLVVVSVWWFAALSLVGRESTSIYKATVTRLRLTGRQRPAAFAASVALPALTVWLIYILASGLADNPGHFVIGPGTFRFSPAYAVAVGIGAGTFAAVTTASRNPLGGSVVVGCATGLALGIFGGSFLHIDVAGSDMYLYTLYAIQMAVGIVAAAGIISILLRDPVPVGVEQRQPQVALRDDLLAAVVSAVVIAVPVLLALGAGAGHAIGIPLVGVWGAGSIAVAAALAFGPLGRHAWFRYRIGIALAAARRRLPWRLNRFFNWATEAGLLRVNGSTYQFRHLELQQWLLRNNEAADATNAAAAATPAGR
jgi:hypothetical protein